MTEYVIGATDIRRGIQTMSDADQAEIQAFLDQHPKMPIFAFAPLQDEWRRRGVIRHGVAVPADALADLFAGDAIDRLAVYSCGLDLYDLMGL